MNQCVYLVYKYADLADSIWTDEELAMKRVKELDADGWYEPTYHKYLMDMPEGLQ